MSYIAKYKKNKSNKTELKTHVEDTIRVIHNKLFKFNYRSTKYLDSSSSTDLVKLQHSYTKNISAV